MAHYEIRFEAQGRFPGRPVVMSCERERFTNREWKGFLLPMLYYLSASSYEYDKLTATVYRNGACVFTVNAESVMECSTLTCSVSINGKWWKDVILAE